MRVVLFQPQIPQNTGNIVRTCAVVGAGLMLVRPLGFSISSKQLKRAGLDYWEGVEMTLVDDLPAFLETSSSPFYFFSSKAEKLYTTIDYGPQDHLIFGSETTGLPGKLRQKWPEKFYRLPMRPNARCLNLSNAVAIVLYEAWRQQQFRV